MERGGQLSQRLWHVQSSVELLTLELRRSQDWTRGRL